MAAAAGGGGGWLLDSSKRVSAEGSEVAVQEPAKQSSRFNALWKGGPGLGPDGPAQAWRIEVLEGKGVWVGLGPEATFDTGFRCKGLLFGGNLSDGAGLKRQNFGPKLDAGRVLEMRAGFQGGVLSVHFRLDGEPLGKAFEVEGAAAKGPLFPLVSFSTGPARAKLTVADACPPAEEFEKGAAPDRDSIDGAWAATQRDLLGDEANEPDAPVAITVSKEHWSIFAKVSNSTSVKISSDPPHASQGPAMQTRMMPPPHLAPLERRVTAIISSVASLELADPQHLKLTCKDGAEFVLSAFTPVLAPVRREEVSWLNR